MRKIKPLLCSQSNVALCLLVLLGTPSALAETITIGKGKGILWEGMPFNVTLSGSMDNASLGIQYGLLAISNVATKCMDSNSLVTVEDYQVLKLAPGVGLIPRVSGNATYTLSDGVIDTLSATIGLPKTEGQSHYGKITSPAGFSWCIPPKMESSNTFYKADAPRTAKISGNWVLVGNGSQKNETLTIPTMYAASFSRSYSGDQKVSILPSDVTLRISTLECTVNTPTSIAFGNVPNYTQALSELGTLSYSLITTCGQKSDFIDANISLQFRPLSGLYNNAPTRLALNQGGGYITGEINNGVTGSGSCTATTGLPFDNTGLKIGNITEAQTNTTFTHQVTWRLCSGGQDLPLGDVSAAAEMLVTFN